MSGSESKTRGVIPYSVVLLLSGCLYYRAEGIASSGNGNLGPAFWPKTVLALAILTCVVAIAMRLYPSRPRAIAAAIGSAPQPARDPPDAAEVHSARASYYPWVGIALAAAYVALFPRLGYFLATILFVAAFIYFGNHRKLWVAALVGVTASFAFMFIFMRIVYVSLPVGMEPFEHVSMFVMGLLGIR